MLQPAIDSGDAFAITQVLARYGHVMDRRDGDGLAMIFTADATFDTTSVGGAIYRGLAELRDFLAMGAAIHPPFHVLSNAWVFRGDDGEARSLSKWITVDRQSGLPRSGDYEDRWELVDGSWLIAERVARARWGGGGWADGYVPVDV